MGFKVFFSWQSDCSNTEGRNLIERALEKAVARIAADGDVEDVIREELAVDKDTKGISGSPPIVDTIFKKIDAAAVFVPDLTFVGTRQGGRPTPNPNVLIEYGWALKSLGHSRIVPIMNVAYGEPVGDAMPFDMRHLRNPITYRCEEGADESARSTAREGLSKALESALRAVFDSSDFKASLPQPPAPPPFPAAEPKDGMARFRASSEAIGYKYDMLGRIMSSQGSEDDGGIWLHGGPAMWLRVMPTIDPGRTLRVAELEQAVRHRDGWLSPLNSEVYSGFGSLYGEDGFGSYVVGAEDSTPAIAYVFTTGEVWMIDTGLLGHTVDYNMLPPVESTYCQALDNATMILSRIGLEGPYHWIAGIEGVKGRCFSPLPAPGHMSILGGRGSPCAANVIEAEGTHAVGISSQQSLKPFFEAIFDKCGLVRPAHMDK